MFEPGFFEVGGGQLHSVPAEQVQPDQLQVEVVIGFVDLWKGEGQRFWGFLSFQRRTEGATDVFPEPAASDLIQIEIVIHLVSVPWVD